VTQIDPITTIGAPDQETQFPPAVRRLIATLTAQVLYHCTIPVEEAEVNKDTGEEEKTQQEATARPEKLAAAS